MDLPARNQAVPSGIAVSLLLPLCSVALFLSAAILFAIEPMFVKMVLPLLGGTPAVWNTAVMFFQAMLLAGYIYAHLLARFQRLRNQALVHVAVLLMGLVFLPVHVGLPWSPAASTHPVPWLIALLAVSIGVPFFAISATAPLLQSWFSRSDHPHASDPYFLYVASNLGGLMALLAYPVLVEPRFGLTLQGQLWTAGYALLTALIAGYALSLWTAQRRRGQGQIAEIAASVDTLPPVSLSSHITWMTRARWVALAFVPSALLLAVTMHISTDVAAAPFLWVAPLLLYSLSFILVFARRPLVKHKWMLRLQPWVYAGTALYFTYQDPLCFVLPLHLLTLFVAAMVFHGELVRRRPVVEHLTEFYLWMSVGGLLGGIFCSLIAPVIFNSILEYPLVLALSGLLLPSAGRASPKGRILYFVEHLLQAPSLGRRLRDPLRRAGAHVPREWLHGTLDIALPAVFAALYFYAQKDETRWDMVHASPVLFYLGIGLILYVFRRRPLRFALVFSVLLFHAVYLDTMDDQLFQQRSFFGVYTVTTDRSESIHKLYHGTTLHGDQDMDEESLLTPRTYYDGAGPLAQVFRSMRAVRKLDRVGVMGLGTGTTTCYQEPGQRMTFFEIDPTIERIARDPKLFRYLELQGQDVEVIIGDGRQSLGRAADETFDLLILDAFSSDAIPVHLLTREALALYLQKLAPGGIILFHISNRYVLLEPVVAHLALDAGAAALIQDYEPTSEDEATVGASSSTWVAVARRSADLGSLATDDRWRTPDPDARLDVWTDDYSNIFRTLTWGVDDVVETLKTAWGQLWRKSK